MASIKAITENQRDMLDTQKEHGVSIATLSTKVSALESRVSTLEGVNTGRAQIEKAAEADKEIVAIVTLGKMVKKHWGKILVAIGFLGTWFHKYIAGWLQIP